MKSTRSSTFWLRSYLIWQTEPKIQRLVFIVWGLLMTTPARADCEDIPPVGNRAAIHFHPESILPVESEASIKVTWLPMTNHRPVLPSRDLYWPMTGQYSGHVTVINQWQASSLTTGLLVLYLTSFVAMSRLQPGGWREKLPTTENKSAKDAVY